MLEDTNRSNLIDMIEEGYVDKDYVLSSLISWLSDQEIAQMADANDIPLTPNDLDR